MDTHMPPHTTMGNYSHDNQSPSYSTLCRAFSDLERRVSLLERRGDPWKSLWSLPSTSLATTNPPAASGSRQLSPSPYQDQAAHHEPHLPHDSEPKISPAPYGNNVRFSDITSWIPFSSSSRHTVGFTDAQPYMNGDRSSSNKSDIFQSHSAAQSVRSIGSGRPNAATTPTSTALNVVQDSPDILPIDSLSVGGNMSCNGVSSSLVASELASASYSSSILLRCWITSEFKQENTQLAAISTCAAESCISSSLVDKFGLSSQIFLDTEGRPKVSLFIYFSEAMELGPQFSSKFPTVNATFLVTPRRCSAENEVPIKILIGGDILSLYSAEISYMSSTVRLSSSNGKGQISVPFSRREDIPRPPRAFPQRTTPEEINPRVENVPAPVYNSKLSMSSSSLNFFSSTSRDDVRVSKSSSDRPELKDLAMPSAGVPSAVDVDALTASCDKPFENGGRIFPKASSAAVADLPPSSTARIRKERTTSSVSVSTVPVDVSGSSATPPAALPRLSPPSQPRHPHQHGLSAAASNPGPVAPTSAPAPVNTTANASANASNNPHPAGTAPQASSGPPPKTSYRAAVTQRNQQAKPKGTAQRSMLVFRPPHQASGGSGGKPGPGRDGSAGVSVGPNGLTAAVQSGPGSAGSHGAHGGTVNGSQVVPRALSYQSSAAR